MNRLKGELSSENKRKRKRNKNNRWKMKNNTKGTQTIDWNLLNKIRKWRWKEEGT